VIAFVVYMLSLPVISPAANSKSELTKSNRKVFGFRNLNFGIIGIFMYVGAEVSIGTYLTNYIADSIQISVNDANSYVAFYWGSMLAGRLIGAYLLKIIRPSLVLSCCALMAVILVGVSIASTGNIAVWSMIGVGLFNSIMFATIFSLAVSGLGNLTTQASGLLSTAIAGGAIISFAQGLIKDHYSWQVAFILPLLCYVYILFYGLNGYKSKFSEL
jgi:FHS family L-fucose permease-like MFS transporter